MSPPPMLLQISPLPSLRPYDGISSHSLQRECLRKYGTALRLLAELGILTSGSGGRLPHATLACEPPSNLVFEWIRIRVVSSSVCSVSASPPSSPSSSSLCLIFRLRHSSQITARKIGIKAEVLFPSSAEESFAVSKGGVRERGRGGF